MEMALSYAQKDCLIFTYVLKLPKSDKSSNVRIKILQITARIKVDTHNLVGVYSMVTIFDLFNYWELIT